MVCSKSVRYIVRILILSLEFALCYQFVDNVLDIAIFDASSLQEKICINRVVDGTEKTKYLSLLQSSILPRNELVANEFSLQLLNVLGHKFFDELNVEFVLDCHLL